MLWMIPRLITPNMITMLRLLLIPLVDYLIIVGEYNVGIPLFIFAAFTDAVDGSLARTRDQVTSFGKVFDPLVDKLLVGSMLIILLLQRVHIAIVVGVLLVEVLFIVSGGIRYLVMKRVPEANRWGKIKVVLQCVALCAIMLGLTFQNPILFAVASWIFGAAILFAVISLFFHGI